MDVIIQLQEDIARCETNADFYEEYASAAVPMDRAFAASSVKNSRSLFLR
jgi:hypothetical protein